MRTWRREDREPNLWFERFTRFRLRGPRRSLLAAYNAEREEQGGVRRTKVPGAWDRAAKQWQWRERAEAWDEHQRQREESAWERRRRDLRKQEWITSQALIDKADQMLKFPLAKTTKEDKSADGKNVVVTTVLPMNWSMRDAANLLKAASQLGRSAVGDDDASADTDWREQARKIGVDPEQLLKRIVTELMGDNGNQNQENNGQEETTTKIHN